MAYKNILVGLCGRGDENIVIKAAMEFSDGGHITFMHVSDPHAGEMSMMMDAPAPKFDESDVYGWISAVDEAVAKSSRISIVTSESIPLSLIHI